ncbi:hypothetical protein AHF37_01621 [Paragonimus kellicotti]|nr:hypothetical protein AHF37_01621 [Paragonimus kellicotti]
MGQYVSSGGSRMRIFPGLFFGLLDSLLSFIVIGLSVRDLLFSESWLALWSIV